MPKKALGDRRTPRVRPSTKGVAYAILTLLFALISVFSLFLLSVLLPIGRLPASATVTMNIVNPSKPLIALPAFLNVTEDLLEVPHSLHPGNPDDDFINREMKEAVMLYFNGYPSPYKEKFLEQIKTKFNHFVRVETYKWVFYMGKLTKSDGKISGGEITIESTGKLADKPEAKDALGKTAGPQGTFNEVGIKFYSPGELEGYRTVDARTPCATPGEGIYCDETKETGEPRQTGEQVRGFR